MTPEEHLLETLLKFGVVGASGLCVDFIITWFCKEKLDINKYVANSTGFTLAVINNFILNYIWTFKESAQGILASFQLFFFFSILGLLLNNACIFIFNGSLQLEFYRSKILAVLIVFLWNFGANYFFNFHSP